MLNECENETIVAVAKWQKSNRNNYAPRTCVSKIPEYRDAVKSLKRKGLLGEYKNGEAYFLTEEGWIYIAASYPEIAKRHGREHTL